jgi:NAD(P)-dependent dehydrogenase (short-subunit alcohol dehydrogenase family)
VPTITNANSIYLSTSNFNSYHSGRIVTLSSSVHSFADHFDFSDIMTEKNFEMFSNYAQSKLANILFTKELQRRWVRALFE